MVIGGGVGGEVSLPERLFVEIRDGIVQGRYRPHERLVENELARELSASRTPIRQALQRLELEGLVISSRHGWVIREHSAEEIREIYDVRIALEGFASRLATEIATDQDIEALVAAHAMMKNHEGLSESADQEVDGSVYVEYHDQFHDVIFSLARNTVLREAIRRYREHPYNRRVAHTYSSAERQQAAASHIEIVAAIRERRSADAEQLTRQHLVLARDVTLQRVAQRV